MTVLYNWRGQAEKLQPKIQGYLDLLQTSTQLQKRHAEVLKLKIL